MCAKHPRTMVRLPDGVRALFLIRIPNHKEKTSTRDKNMHATVQSGT